MSVGWENLELEPAGEFVGVLDSTARSAPMH